MQSGIADDRRQHADCAGFEVVDCNGSRFIVLPGAYHVQQR
jgi:hypothetical protein